MSIWEYGALDSSAIDGTPGSLCIFCKSKLHRISAEPGGEGHEETCPYCHETPTLGINVCDGCGWWYINDEVEKEWANGECSIAWESRHYSAMASLKNLELTDLTLPLQDVRQYLVARYSDRYLVHPRKFEEVVGSIFKDFGCDVRVTSYSGDDGVDLFVFDRDEGLVGIQVKRWQGKIQAEQIRGFAGALVLNGVTKGIFITTSQFTRGARETASRYEPVGLGVKLEDADRFYDRLGIANRLAYSNMCDPSAPLAQYLAGNLIPYCRIESGESE